MAFRLDKGTLGKVELTPQGGIKVPAYVTRTGVFEYTTEEGKVIKEYRPPEEVFHKDALATMPDAPVTNEHPPEHISPENFKKYTVGHTKEVKQDEDKVAASMVIQDAATIRSIMEDGKSEVSCGYHCDVDEVPGVLPDGTKYDRVQRNIRYNHIAVVAHGRAGHEVRLRLDSAGNQIKESTMKIEVIDGADYEVGSSAHAAAVKRREDSERKRLGQVKKLEEQVAAEKTRADKATELLAKTTSEVKEALSPKRIDHLVRVRGAVIRRARHVLGAEFKTDGLSNAKIKRAAVEKLHPKMRFDGKDNKVDSAVIRKLFREIDPQQGRADSKDKALPAHLKQAPVYLTDRPSQTQSGVTLDQLRQRRADEDAERHRRPLAVSKSNPHREVDNYPSVQGSMLETMK